MVEAGQGTSYDVGGQCGGRATVFAHEPSQVVIAKLAGQPELAGLSQIRGAASD